MTKIAGHERVKKTLQESTVQYSMNSQFWLSNILFLGTFGVIICYLYCVVPRAPLKVNLAIIHESIDTPNNEKMPAIDAIYERDFFNAMPIISETEIKQKYIQQTLMVVPSFPQPPAPIKATDLTTPPPQFLPPLSLLLKGTILSSNPAHNRIFIENTKTKEEKTAKLGDMVEDAQIIFIGKNKAIFIRSNGQEEILYTNPSAAQEEIDIARTLPWHKIIQENTHGEHIINTSLITKRTPTVGHFLEELDLITAFDGPLPIGCQVGYASPESLVYALGLETSDIITHVNDISTATPEDRIIIYQMLATELSHDKLITARIKRKGKEIINKYRLNLPELPTIKKQQSILGLGKEKIYRGKSYKEQHAKNQVDASITYARDATQEAQKINQENIWRGGKEHVLYRQIE